MKRLSFFILASILLTGCGTISPYQKRLDKIADSQRASGEKIMQRVAVQKQELAARRTEAEKAHADGKISEAEYLSIKNQLAAELHQINDSADRDLNDDLQNANFRIRSLGRY